MKQKTKLIIAFLATIIIPILLFTSVFVVFRTAQMKELKEKYGISNEDYSYLLNSIQLMNRYTANEYKELKDVALHDSIKLETPEYLEETNLALIEKNSYLVVLKNDECVYFGGDDTQRERLKALPDFNIDSLDINQGVYLDSDDQSIIKQVDFKFSDQNLGRAFIITEAKEMSFEAKQLLKDLLISVVIILLLTSMIVAIWIYQSMMAPIQKLTVATQNIMDENLDFEIASDSNDEIGELCENFELMRKKLKELSDEREENEKQNRELISNISHDLKTPLTAIQGYVEGIVDGVADTPEKLEHYIQTIYKKTKDMSRLINELTMYSQIDQNRIPYNFNKINVVGLFSDCAEDLEIELSEKNIAFTCECDVTPDVEIIADPEQLSRVINNIISNSVKYMDKPEGKIALRIKDADDFIQVEFEDNGRGIKRNELPYIFDRFYRADASRNSATGGSGIGLSVVKKIIEDHGGKIWASGDEGKGTTMTFVLRKYQEQQH